MPDAAHAATRPATLFTVGYEGRVQPELVNLLFAAGVAVVLDVRAVPQSRKPGLSKTLLGHSLREAGIDYVHDRRLGTPKPGRQAARAGRTAEMAAIFRAHMDTPAARDGLADAVSLASEKPVCLLCFEREPHTCHRSIVAEMMGLSVRHL